MKMQLAFAALNEGGRGGGGHYLLEVTNCALVSVLVRNLVGVASGDGCQIRMSYVGLYGPKTQRKMRI